MCLLPCKLAAVNLAESKAECLCSLNPVVQERLILITFVSSRERSGRNLFHKYCTVLVHCIAMYRHNLEPCIHLLHLVQYAIYLLAGGSATVV
jgi:hypothetical protein